MHFLSSGHRNGSKAGHWLSVEGESYDDRDRDRDRDCDHDHAKDQGEHYLELDHLLGEAEEEPEHHQDETNQPKY